MERAVGEIRAAGVTAAVVVQPTISDGRLGPMLSRLWDRPVVMWATTEKQEGDMISANSLVGTHVMSATLRQLGHPLELVYGHPDEDDTTVRLDRAIRCVHAAACAEESKLGLIGYHAPGFVDFHADPVFLNDSLRAQLYHMSTLELVQMVRGFSDEDVAEEVEAFRALGLPHGEGISKDGTTEFDLQARYYKAFRTLFDQERFQALAFRCWPDLPREVGHWPYVALVRLVSEGFPIAMEGDVDGAICSLLAEQAGIGPVYLSDWLEHDEHTITIWHVGAAPIQLAKPVGDPAGPRLGLQFNTKQPTVVESTIRPDMEATLFRLWRYDDAYHMTALEGRTAEPRRHLKATNGLFTTDEVDVREWFEDQVQIGMPHHVCVIQGHHGETLRRIARLLGVNWV